MSRSLQPWNLRDHQPSYKNAKAYHWFPSFHETHSTHPPLHVFWRLFRSLPEAQWLKLCDLEHHDGSWAHSKGACGLALSRSWWWRWEDCWWGWEGVSDKENQAGSLEDGWGSRRDDFASWWRSAAAHDFERSNGGLGDAEECASSQRICNFAGIMQKVFDNEETKQSVDPVVGERDSWSSVHHADVGDWSEWSRRDLGTHSGPSFFFQCCHHSFQCHSPWPAHHRPRHHPDYSMTRLASLWTAIIPLRMLPPMRHFRLLNIVHALMHLRSFAFSVTRRVITRMLAPRRSCGNPTSRKLLVWLKELIQTKRVYCLKKIDFVRFFILFILFFVVCGWSCTVLFWFSLRGVPFSVSGTHADLGGCVELPNTSHIRYHPPFDTISPIRSLQEYISRVPYNWAPHAFARVPC